MRNRLQQPVNQILIGIFLLISLSFLSQCSGPSGSSIERGHDPFVFRSVLDRKARIVTVALKPDFWVAYDANSCGLFKVWRDGVNFDGPVYTTKHGPQPTSVGPFYLENENPSPWLLSQNGKTDTVKAVYRGHRYDKGKATFTYEIALDNGAKITIKESPEYLSSGSAAGLERVFTTSGMPEGAQLHLLTHINSITSEASIETDGTLETLNKEDIDPVINAIKIDGKLTLNANAITSMAIKFTKDPMVSNLAEESAKAQDPALALIEGKGCKTCHNTEEKAVGPAYVEVAERYPTNPKSVNDLAAKIINGGTGVWGEQIMTPHLDLSEADAKTMVNWILALDPDDEGAEEAAEGRKITYGKASARLIDPGRITAGSNTGLAINIYQFDELNKLPSSLPDKPVFSTSIPLVHFLGVSPMKPFRENFYIKAIGNIQIDKETKYDFRLVSDDGSRLKIDGKTVIDHDGTHGDSAMDGEVNLTEGKHKIEVEYFQKGGGIVWSLQWMPFGAEAFEIIPESAFSFEAADQLEAEPTAELARVGVSIPGDASEVLDVHPSYDLSQARPDDFEPKVGGMDFLSDGSMVVSTWTPNGTVYKVEGATTGDPSKMKATVIAEGLAEPLGLKVVDDEIYVLQKQELTHLIDHDGDGKTDEYRTLCGAWKVSANFHEFAFGLAYKDGFFYAALATAIEPGGKSTNPQIPDRGKVVKISREDGSHEFMASGLRTPNGIGWGVDGELFVADNQGDWLPASKIVHITEGAWLGSRSVDPEGTKDLPDPMPVVWLPQDEIGNSPSTPSIIPEGPYKGQMVHGEVTHGGVKRVFVEKVGGQYQGVVFRFIQGLEAGVNRLVWGPDDALYIGGVGSTGNWQNYGKYWYGLQRLKYNEKTTFEMLAVRAKSDGIEIEFTEPLAPGYGLLTKDYLIKQWYYKPTIEYGGPKLDLETITPNSVHLSADRKKVFLELDGMKEGHVIYTRLIGNFISDSNQELWSTEAWYTLNKIPQNIAGERSTAYTALDNQLTPAEESAGFKLLFDGEKIEGWRNYNKQTIGSGWIVDDNCLALVGEKVPKDDNPNEYRFKDGGNIVTDQSYENYELRIDWKISPNGNSGIIYNVVEDPEVSEPYMSGPEMQVLDNQGHPDAKIHMHRAGDLYDLIPCKFETVKPAGEWNHARLINNNGHVEHWLNGYKVVEYDMDENWPEMVANSKFHEWPPFGKAKGGHICLQDHDNDVWYKNIKIRELK